MKKICTTIFVLTIIISACSPSLSATLPSASESTLTATQVPATLTATETPPIPPTFTPTPALSLPVSQLTPVPSSSTKITAENVQSLQEIAKYYGDVNYFAKVTKDNKFLFILDPEGLTKYDYASMETITHVAVANSVSDLQIGDDGSWILIDNNWLLDLRKDQESKLNVLSEKIDLLNFGATFSLLPDGSMIAVAQSRCPNTCEHIFRVISTDDFQVLYTTSGLTSRRLAAFSPEGTYFAAADLLTVETSGGGTEPAGGTVGVWTTSDFTKVSSISINFPFRVSSIAFSEDNSLIAIAQENSIDIFDVLNGESRASISNLCESPERKVMFAPATPLRILEHSDCNSGAWTISGSTATVSSRDVPDFSRIVFDEKGNFKAIPYTQPVISDVKASGLGYFEFLNNDVISFQNHDYEASSKCELSLASGAFDCQSHTLEYSNGRYLGKDVILATDGKYFSYVVGNSRVDIYSFEDPSQIYYSIPFRDYTFYLSALDPINNIIIYNISLNPNVNRVVIQDMTNDRILEKWEGQTHISSLAISKNTKYATICRVIGNYNDGTDKDRLVIFDLSEKRTAYNTDFNCNGTVLALSSDGAKLVSENGKGATSTTAITRVMILHTSPPYATKNYDFDSWFYPHAAVFSPDGSMLVAGCSKNEICFMDPSDSREIYRMKAHSGISNLAFSKDGSVLATSSNWGLISLWAVPPFTSNARQAQSSPLSSYTPGFSWDFNQDGWFEGWGEQDWQSGDLNNLKVKSGSLSASATGNDPQIYSSEGLGIDANKFSHIEIRMHVSEGDSAQLFFRNENNDLSENKSITFPIESETEFKTYILDMSKISSWKNIIYQLRLDPTSDVIGATIEIDYIRLLP